MRTILIIEDDISVRNMVRDFLELEKITTITAENGQAGLELANKYLPDLIISDIMMPQLDGLGLKKELGKNPVTALIPFIFLTSKSEREDIRLGMEIGADDYLFKPVKLEELIKSINVQFEKRKSMIDEYTRNEKKENKQEFNYNEYIMVKDKGNPKFIRVNRVKLVLAYNKYSRLVLENNDKIITSRTLKEWEIMLPALYFVRVHRSTLINLDYVEKVDKWFNRSYKIKLKNFNEDVIISKRYYAIIKNHF